MEEGKRSHVFTVASGRPMVLAVCETCHSCILVDPQDEVDQVEEHMAWHRRGGPHMFGKATDPLGGTSGQIH